MEKAITQMTFSEDEFKAQQLPTEDLLRDKVINHVVIMWAVLCIIAFVFTNLRASKIGWTARDLIYFILLTSAIGTALVRRKLTLRHKAISS